MNLKQVFTFLFIISVFGITYSSSSFARQFKVGYKTKEEANCWWECDKKTGSCDFCGKGSACCRNGWSDKGPQNECVRAGGCNGYHCCVKQANCWWECDKKTGHCPKFCGEGKACCRKGWGDVGQSKECLGANVGCNGYHCCVDATKTQTRTVTSRSRYYVGKDARTADAAQAFCKQAKGNLVTIDDAAENKYVNDLLQKRNIDNAWIGYNDKASEGKFVWFSGATSCYTNWSNKEPNNVNNEDCTHMRKGGTWNDHNCGKQILAFVCEF